MRKLFVVVLLASASIVACGGKKANTTPANPDPAMPAMPAMHEKNGSPTGGATYGGKAPAPTGKDNPNPSSGK